MYRIRTCRCECCGLELDIQIDVERPFDRPVCSRCSLHQDDAAIRYFDHASMYRNALATAQDETALAHGERDFYRERSITTARNAETLIHTLTEIDDLHHRDRDGACSCRRPDCRVAGLLGEPAVARLIGTYDEHQHTLHELRRANPGAWAKEWDYIDVTLVYPPRTRRPGGRHRAAS